MNQYLWTGIGIATVNLIIMIKNSRGRKALVWFSVYALFTVLTVYLWPPIVLLALIKARISPLTFFMMR